MSGSEPQRRVLVTGGAGYVGSRLVPKLLDAGYGVTVLDLYLFGDVFADIADRPGLRQVHGDIRDAAHVKEAVHGCDAVIHLACISNDPSFELDPVLGKSINLDAFRPARPTSPFTSGLKANRSAIPRRASPGAPGIRGRNKPARPSA